MRVKSGGLDKQLGAIMGVWMTVYVEEESFNAVKQEREAE